MTTGLIHFIQERLDEDERSARAATPGPWVSDEPWLADWVKSGILGHVADCSIGAGYRAQSIPDAAHIARYDPARALAEIDTKRRIVQLYTTARGWADRAEDIQVSGNNSQVASVAYLDVLRLLALPYADHPEFREEWRP
ncbi:DUF6221 family protein [Streptomyces sp. NPDC001194]|uniref:DUF6221 family protein n=1 Tax=Streptomyces sp. NPDC001194 TaxID=3364547 RepID=UPI003691E4D9